jgi:transposase
MSTALVAPTVVIGGVDTHKDIHVAAALDERGTQLGIASFPTTPAGYAELLDWLASFGIVDAVGVEGTGTWGAGLTRHLQSHGITVLEVDRPNRQRRRKHGKSDPTDAVSAGRAVISGETRAYAKDRTGPVEQLRVLRVARRSARMARNQAVTQLRSILATAPADLREQLRDLKLAKLVETCAAFRLVGRDATLDAYKQSMRSLARRVQDLDTETAELADSIEGIVQAAAPEMLEIKGVGPDTASALLVVAGDNADRVKNESAFARLCGVSPLEASSGKTIRHRLNRTGDRQANSALWRIVLVRMGTDDRTRDYVERRLAEGKSKREIMRCLKRYVAREIFKALPRTPSTA